uniref:IS3 family transposase n=1 Tax=Pseudomonas saliphila TaxID=2586906 RepID=UPI001F2028DF|nr:IS3 family transposase [Pseudomonas saliphila]
MNKYTEQFRIAVCKAYLEGDNGFRKVARQFDVDVSLLRRWVSSYRLHGVTSLSKPGQQYTPDFKREVVGYKRAHHLSLRQVAAHFGLGHSSLVGIWERQYYSNGSEPQTLAKQRKPAMSNKPKPAPPPAKEDALKSREQLMTEIEYLRMENAYLKELEAFAGTEKAKAAENTRIVAKLKSRFPLASLLKLSGLARSTFYYQLRVQQRPDKDALLKQWIQQVYARERGLYGYRRITAVLRATGTLVNKKVVERLMAELNLRSVVRPKRYRSYRGEVGRIAPNLLERNFHAQCPNQKWVTDVTEFKVAQKKLYLSPVMDLYNREIVAYEMANRPSFALVDNMLNKALVRLQEQPKLVIHSDQGWHYQQRQYRQKLAVHGVSQSMSRKGNCLDNAAMESFFGTLKSEFFYLKHFESIEELKTGLDEYIHYYNHDRIKLSLNSLSPVVYRNRAVEAR